MQPRLSADFSGATRTKSWFPLHKVPTHGCAAGAPGVPSTHRFTTRPDRRVSRKSQSRLLVMLQGGRRDTYLDWKCPLRLTNVGEVPSGDPVMKGPALPLQSIKSAICYFDIYGQRRSCSPSL